MNHLCHHVTLCHVREKKKKKKKRTQSTEFLTEGGVRGDARKCRLNGKKENVRKSLNTIRIIHCGFFVCVKRQIYGEVCQMCLPCWIEKYCAIYQEALSYEDFWNIASCGLIGKMSTVKEKWVVWLRLIETGSGFETDLGMIPEWFRIDLGLI